MHTFYIIMYLLVTLMLKFSLDLDPNLGLSMNIKHNAIVYNLNVSQ